VNLKKGEKITHTVIRNWFVSNHRAEPKMPKRSITDASEELPEEVEISQIPKRPGIEVVFPGEAQISQFKTHKKNPGETVEQLQEKLAAKETELAEERIKSQRIQKSYELQLASKDAEWDQRLQDAGREALSKQASQSSTQVALQAKDAEWAQRLQDAVREANTTKDAEWAQRLENSVRDANTTKDAEWAQRLQDAVREANTTKDAECVQKLEKAAREALGKQTSQWNMRLALHDDERTRRWQEVLEEAKDTACESLRTELGVKVQALDDMKAELQKKTSDLEDLQWTLGLSATENNAVNEKNRDLTTQLDRFSDLTIKQRETRLIERFESIYKRQNRRRRIPAYASFLIRDYIMNTCLNDLSRRPLMVSRVALELGHTKLQLRDLLKVGIIASNIHRNEKGHRPPKALHCSGGKMCIDTCIYMDEDRWMIEDALEKYTGQVDAW